jgi:hypothetical protein
LVIREDYAPELELSKGLAVTMPSHEIPKAELEPEIPTHAEDDDFPVEMAAFEKIIYALHGGQPSSCRSLTGKYAPLAPFAPEPQKAPGSGVPTGLPS